MRRYLPLLFLSAATTAWTAPPPGLDPVVQFLENHCFECHDSDTTKGDFDIEPLLDGDGISDAKSAVLWTEVLDQLALGEMPPKKKPQPETESLLQATDWIRRQLEQFYSRGDHAGENVLRRLNRSEYKNTIRDLLGVDFEPGDRFPSDDSYHGFDNIGKALAISTPLLERYLEAAEEVTGKAVLSGAKPERKKRRESRKKIDCELGIRQPNGGIEIASNREGRARVFPVKPVTFEGDYKVRFRVSPVRSEGKKLGVRLKTGLPDRELTVSLKQVDEFYLTEPTTFEKTVRIKEGDSVHVSFMNGGPIPIISRQRTYKGAAVVIEWIEIDGPIIKEWPPATYRELIAPADGKRDIQGARAVLHAFADRAFRRPTPDSLVDPLVATFSEELSRGGSFDDGLRAAIQVALCSPHFLYVNVPTTAPGEEDKLLDDFGLASRLSYFLWSSMPDAPLLASAKSGKLTSDPGELRRQANRMLANPKAEAFIANFVGQWLRTRDVGSMKPDPRLFRSYDAELEASMKRETELFIAHLIEKNLSIFNVLDSDFTFLNERLASHYGIEGIAGDPFRKVSLQPGSKRGGVLGHASFLTVTSNGTNTSPIVRGMYILENLLGTPPPPPPPDIEPIEPDTRGTTTIRDQLAKHRDSPTCYDCHQKIDPLGFALESFDPIGAERDRYRGAGKNRRKWPKVSTDTETADGTPIDGVSDLRGYLTGKRHLYAKALAEKLTLYATGRPTSFNDRKSIDDVASRALRPQGKKPQKGFRTFINNIVASDAFRRR